MDAANHPNPASFDVWAASDDGTPCPYYECKVARVVPYFTPNKKVWRERDKTKDGQTLSILALAIRILDEMGCKHSLGSELASKKD
jgi:hypothetical protein